MTNTSNMDQVIAWLMTFANSFKFDRPGIDQSLGRDVGHAIVRGPEVGQLGGILGRCADGVGPDGQSWEPNAPAYRAYKLKMYGHDEVNRRTGQMLAEQSFQIVVQPDMVQVIYGLGVPPDRSTAPTGYMSKGDMAVTDREKAEFAHGGKGRGRDEKGRFTKGRRARPFFGWNKEDYRNVIAVCQANLNEYIRQENAKNT